MFRHRTRLTAFFAALLLTALQLHAVLHGFGHAESGGPEPACELCDHVLHQVSLVSPEPVQAPTAFPGFELAPVSTVSFHPQYRCFTPALRGPPALS
jgi:hypothetical protein